MKISDIWPAYLDRCWERGHSRSKVNSLGRRVLEEFGHLDAFKINQKEVDFYTSLRTREGVVSSTVRRELTMLRAVLGMAFIPINFRLPEGRPARERWHDHDEIDRLLQAAREMRAGVRMSRGERFLWLSLETGARAGAILDLAWDRVDFQRRVVHFAVPGQRKTNKRRASVPMSERLYSALCYAATYRCSDRLVMTSSTPMWATIQRIAARAGVEHTFPHAMRHTVATHMLRNDVPLWKVAKILGDSPATVDKTYGKHTVEDLREGVGAISRRAA